jgi:hypothetical protein
MKPLKGQHLRLYRLFLQIDQGHTLKPKILIHARNLKKITVRKINFLQPIIQKKFYRAISSIYFHHKGSPLSQNIKKVDNT